MKSREQDRLAAEARARANEVAYDGFNRKLLNRWKVSSSCLLHCSTDPGHCFSSREGRKAPLH